MTQKIVFEDIKEGDALPSFTVTVTRTHIVKFAGAGGDFNPIHHDEELAKSLGLPSVFAMGLMQGGYLSKILTDWAGPASVKQYKVRFKGMVWPGDTITCQGEVVRLYRENGEGLAECRLEVVNQNGEQAIEGEAVVCVQAAESEKK